jgi:TusA-related sulfurtransferase
VGDTSSALRDMDTGEQIDVETDAVVSRILRERGLGA